MSFTTRAADYWWDRMLNTGMPATTMRSLSNPVARTGPSLTKINSGRMLSSVLKRSLGQAVITPVSSSP